LEKEVIKKIKQWPNEESIETTQMNNPFTDFSNKNSNYHSSLYFLGHFFDPSFLNLDISSFRTNK